MVSGDNFRVCLLLRTDNKILMMRPQNQNKGFCKATLYKSAALILFFLLGAKPNQAQTVLDFTTSRSKTYYELAYDVATAVCPNSADDWHCLRITNFKKDRFVNKRAYFLFMFKGKKSMLSSMETFYMLLELSIDESNKIRGIWTPGWADDDCYTALKWRSEFLEQSDLGKRLYSNTVNRNYKLIIEKAKALYEY